MDMVLAGRTAFQFHRIPSQVAMLVNEELDVTSAQGPRMLARRQSYFHYLTTPLEILVFERRARHASKGIHRTLWTGELPVGSVWDIDAYLKVASPAFTLFLLAQCVSIIQLVMAMYEFTGRFTVFAADPKHMEYLEHAGALSDASWRLAPVRSGQSTLWMRPPLVTIEELWDMCEKTRGRRGHKAFERALKEVKGVVASPLEARAVIRLCGSRLLGGEGFGPVELNSKVRFSRAARAVTGQDHGIVDILFPADDRHKDYAYECQGRAVHGPYGLTGADANRLLGLQLMGIDTALLTYEQLADQYRFEQVRRLTADKLHARYQEKSAALLEHERQLRRELFIDWEDLCGEVR